MLIILDGYWKCITNTKLITLKSHIYWKDSEIKLFSNWTYYPEMWNICAWSKKQYQLRKNDIVSEEKERTYYSRRIWTGSLLYWMVSCHVDAMLHDTEGFLGHILKNCSFPRQVYDNRFHQWKPCYSICMISKW